MFNEKFLFGFLNLGDDDMYAYLATGTASISGNSEGSYKKTFILPAPTNGITISTGEKTSYVHLRINLQTPEGNNTLHSGGITYEGETDSIRSTSIAGFFPQGTKIVVTEPNSSNAMYSTCKYNTLTFYKIPSDFLGGGN